MFWICDAANASIFFFKILSDSLMYFWKPCLNVRTAQKSLLVKVAKVADLASTVSLQLRRTKFAILTPKN
jgi:hypothetical protein